MITKTITFEDFAGNMRTETHCFNLTKAELFQFMMTSGDYTIDKVLLRLAEERNGKKIMETVEDLIRRSYGKPSLDGRKFEKNDKIWEDFHQTEAYSELFTELVTDANATAAFVNGIIPAKLAKELEKEMTENLAAIPDAMKDYVTTSKSD